MLIVSVDEINRAPARLAIIAPITTTTRGQAAVRIELPHGRTVRAGYVEPYQVRTISHDRLGRRIGAAPPEVSREVAQRISTFTRWQGA